MSELAAALVLAGTALYAGTRAHQQIHWSERGPTDDTTKQKHKALLKEADIFARYERVQDRRQRAKDGQVGLGAKGATRAIGRYTESALRKMDLNKFDLDDQKTQLQWFASYDDRAEYPLASTTGFARRLGQRWPRVNEVVRRHSPRDASPASLGKLESVSFELGRPVEKTWDCKC
jgi:hypothetical protein